MTDTAVTIREAEQDDMDRIETLLDANGLPTGDVRTNPELFVAVAADVVGAGGVELYGSAGLLRSVVVEESSRGRGYGALLCEELEAHARTNGVETLYLLTTTAPEFFRQRGYEETPRDVAPPRIQETIEFSSLCPDSATCMRKHLR